MQTLTDLARSLNFRSGWSHVPSLILLTDDVRLNDPLPLIRTLPPGSWVILRHYGAENRTCLAEELAKVCKAKRLIFSVAGDYNLALCLKAGLHLPQGMAAVASPKIRIYGRRAPLTAASHDRKALRRAAEIGCWATLLSPVFPTQSHPGAPTLGPLRFRKLTRACPIPVFALGGVTAQTIHYLSGSKAAGIATVSGLNHQI